MKTVWKFPLKPTGVQKVQIPKDSNLLTIRMQNQYLCLWALVETDKEVEDRFITIIGTGDKVPENVLRYIGTFQLAESNFVGHVFEVKGELVLA